MPTGFLRQKQKYFLPLVRPCFGAVRSVRSGISELVLCVLPKPVPPITLNTETDGLLAPHFCGIIVWGQVRLPRWPWSSTLGAKRRGRLWRPVVFPRDPSLPSWITQRQHVSVGRAASSLVSICPHDGGCGWAGTVQYFPVSTTNVKFHSAKLT